MLSPSSSSECARPLKKTCGRPCRSSSTGTTAFPGERLAQPPTAGIYRSSLPSSETTSRNCGQSHCHGTSPRLSLSTRTWQILPMSSSGMMQYGALWNRPIATVTRF